MNKSSMSWISPNKQGLIELDSLALLMLPLDLIVDSNTYWIRSVSPTPFQSETVDANKIETPC